NTDLFERVTIERIEKHFRRVLDSVVAHPERPIGELLILSEGEQRHLATWNTTEQAYASTAGIHELIEAQVERSPARVAAVFEQDSLTYRTLNGRANQLAHALRQRGVGQDTRVGLCVERSLDMVVALLAILKTGAAYVPLDPHYPAERTRFMLEDSEARVLVTQSRFVRALPTAAVDVVCLDLDADQWTMQPTQNPPRAGQGDDVAYVIYTSGSTGAPKGVIVTHRGVVNLLESMRREPGLRATDRLLAVTTLSFDIAGLELYLPLISGATVEIASEAVAIDGHRLRERLERGATTVMQA